jgi:hypothetical protein
MPRTAIEIAPSITVRDETGQLVETSLRDVSSEASCRAQPYRTFRWYLGQRHYSGFPPRLIGVADCCCR